jgi:hypothetical protein
MRKDYAQVAQRSQHAQEHAIEVDDHECDLLERSMIQVRRWQRK